jgi:hypothetical protein
MLGAVVNFTTMEVTLSSFDVFVSGAAASATFASLAFGADVGVALVRISGASTSAHITTANDVLIGVLASVNSYAPSLQVAPWRRAVVENVVMNVALTAGASVTAAAVVHALALKQIAFASSDVHNVTFVVDLQSGAQFSAAMVLLANQKSTIAISASVSNCTIRASLNLLPSSNNVVAQSIAALIAFVGSNTGVTSSGGASDAGGVFEVAASVLELLPESTWSAAQQPVVALVAVTESLRVVSVAASTLVIGSSSALQAEYALFSRVASRAATTATTTTRNAAMLVTAVDSRIVGSSSAAATCGSAGVGCSLVRIDATRPVAGAFAIHGNSIAGRGALVTVAATALAQSSTIFNISHNGGTGDIAVATIGTSSGSRDVDLRGGTWNLRCAESRLPLFRDFARRCGATGNINTNCAPGSIAKSETASPTAKESRSATRCGVDGQHAGAANAQLEASPVPAGVRGAFAAAAVAAGSAGAAQHMYTTLMLGEIARCGSGGGGGDSSSTSSSSSSSLQPLQFDSNPLGIAIKGDDALATYRGAAVGNPLVVLLVAALAGLAALFLTRLRRPASARLTPDAARDKVRWPGVLAPVGVAVALPGVFAAVVVLSDGSGLRRGVDVAIVLPALLLFTALPTAAGVVAARLAARSEKLELVPEEPQSSSS